MKFVFFTLIFNFIFILTISEFLKRKYLVLVHLDEIRTFLAVVKSETVENNETIERNPGCKFLRLFYLVLKNGSNIDKVQKFISSLYELAEMMETFYSEFVKFDFSRNGKILDVCILPESVSIWFRSAAESYYELYVCEDSLATQIFDIQKQYSLKLHKTLDELHLEDSDTVTIY